MKWINRSLAWASEKLIKIAQAAFDVFVVIDAWWETKSVKKQLSIKNTFHKILLILIIVFQKFYGDYFYNLNADRAADLQRATQKDLTKYIEKETQRLEKNNEEYEKVKNELKKSQETVNELLEQLKHKGHE